MPKYLTFLSLILCLSANAADLPTSTDPRLTIQLVAQEPEINTPTSVAVDSRGRIFVIENNTHFTPKNYKGYPTDRIQILEDFAPDGRAKKISTFAEGFKNSMGLVLLKDGSAIFATRSEIMRLSDPNNTGKSTEQKSLIKLDTAGNYPHNGLAGLTLGPDGLLYLGLGENLGADYKITGSDGVTLSGGGEGGNIYRCTLEGAKLEKIATGFWNPWGLGFDNTGRLFAVDNDPDSRPPCRLLHVVQNGDYGYKFRYGRKGTHPFSAWNGEIPGTLPMVAGTGEAPCAVYACLNNFPSEYFNNLLVTSWGDHVIQRFKLKPLGASFESIPETLIKGSIDFRPVGLAQAPDGSLIVTDWVKQDYPVHGKGRVWRIRSKEQATPPIETRAVPGIRLDIPLKDATSVSALLNLCDDPDPFQFNAAVDALVHLADIESLKKSLTATNPRERLAALLALRRSAIKDVPGVLTTALSDSDATVRRAAMQWAGEDRVKDLHKQLDDSAKLPMTRDLFEAYLAAKSLLSGDKPDKGEYIESQMSQIFPSDRHPAHLRALALKNLRVDHPGMKIEILVRLLAEKDLTLRAEAIRALSLHPHPDAQPELRKLATDASLSESQRADAIAGLARSANTDAETRKLLVTFLNAETSAALQREALRALRGATSEPGIQTAVRALAAKTAGNSELAEQIKFTLKSNAGEIPPELDAAIGKRPANETEWAALLIKLDTAGDPAAGARIFYHARGPQCFSCHRINGRGGLVGPDLTTIGKTVMRDRILQSILEPARDVAPQFLSWMFVMKDGRRITGTIIEENNGTVQVGESTGVVTKIKTTDIDSRAPQKGSVMPDNLVDLLTQQELRDLIAFLLSN